MSYRDTYIKIDLDKLKHNLSILTKESGQKSLFCVVKANAYGHGAVPISNFLINQSEVDYLCVSSLDEALELRDAEISFPIIILGYVDPKHVMICIENNITISIVSLEYLNQLLLESIEIKKLKAHVKIDSGMNRLGIKNIQDFKEVITTCEASGIKLEGIFTHYHSADASDNSYILDQYRRFNEFLQATNYHFKWIHISNSDAVFSHHDTTSNAIRCGLAMYGYSKKSNALQPVLSLYTHVTQIKKVFRNEVISYSATYKSDRDQLIAILPIGYADGLNRKLQDHHLFINGNPARILGRVCMDQLIIEYPNNCTVETVEIIGDSQNCDDIAKILDTIPYEILTTLSDRITRKYYLDSTFRFDINFRYK
jgi:alanine racemase